MAELITEVADGLFLGRGTDVNWVLARDRRDVTVVDACYPGDADRLQKSIQTIGGRVAAVLITHAHIGHIGGANDLHDAHGAPVYTDAVEVRHAHRDHLEQAPPLDVAKNLWRPGVAPWLGRVLRVGVTKHVAIPSAQPFPAEGPLDLPGRPVPVPTHGHTSGHTAYLFPAARAVATGDELVTGHAVLRGTGPSVLPAIITHSDPLAVFVRFVVLVVVLVLPGHGEPLHRPIRAAVREARARADRRRGDPAS